MSDITITVKEAAAFFEVSPRTIQYWIRQGIFPNAYKRNRNNPRNSPYRIPYADIDQLAQQNSKRAG